MIKETKWPRLKWTKDMDFFLIEIENRFVTRKELYKIFLEKFPNSGISFNAFNSERSRIGCVKYKAPHASTAQRPLYSERIRKGYVEIKVAMGSGNWWPKARWVYLETHPWEWTEALPTDNYFFLDGDQFNFDPDNIVRVAARERTAFIHQGGVIKGNPKQSMLNLLMARLRIAQFDAAEKIGLVKPSKKGSYGRYFYDEIRARTRIYNKRIYADPEKRKKRAEYARKRYHSLKNDPIFQAQRRETCKRYVAKRKVVVSPSENGR